MLFFVYIFCLFYFIFTVTAIVIVIFIVIVIVIIVIIVIIIIIIIIDFSTYVSFLGLVFKGTQKKSCCRFGCSGAGGKEYGIVLFCRVGYLHVCRVEFKAFLLLELACGATGLCFWNTSVGCSERCEGLGFFRNGVDADGRQTFEGFQQSL